MAVVQIGEQLGLSGFPAEGLAGDEVRCREIQRDQVRQEAKVPRQHQYVRGNAYGGDAQTAANGLGDGTEWNALALDPVPVFASLTLFQRQAKQGGEVTGVYGRPQVRAFSRVTHDALFLRQPD